jgi:hypothetical protein
MLSHRQRSAKQISIVRSLVTAQRAGERVFMFGVVGVSTLSSLAALRLAEPIGMRMACHAFLGIAL